MAYVAVVDPTNPNTSPITGIFAVPQNAPVPPGYIGYVPDTDPRVAVFLSSMSGSSQG